MLISQIMGCSRYYSTKFWTRCECATCMMARWLYFKGGDSLVPMESVILGTNLSVHQKDSIALRIVANASYSSAHFSTSAFSALKYLFSPRCSTDLQAGRLVKYSEGVALWCEIVKVFQWNVLSWKFDPWNFCSWAVSIVNQSVTGCDVIRPEMTYIKLMHVPPILDHKLFTHAI